MLNHSDELSQEMYHRIYRMIKRNIEPRLIAATLNLPLKTVSSIVLRMKEKKDSTTTDSAAVSSQYHSVSDFLDVYLYTKTRYAIIQLVGVLHRKNLYLLENEVEKSLTAPWKATALRLTDVLMIDSDSCNFILNSFKKFQDAGRYLAILDPSAQIEASLSELKIEDTVPIFGTERAFEDAAFPKKSLFRKT
jgi:anti-anti-sigma regulatory factor